MQQFDTKKTERKTWISSVTINCTLFLFSVLYVINGSAQNYTPNTFTDPVITSLNNATGEINGGATISLRSALMAADNLGGTHIVTLSTGTYNLSTAPNSQITIGNTAQTITINGNGPANTIINMVNDANRDRILFINPSGTTNDVITNVSGIRFQNGYLTSDFFGGAGICAGGGTGNALTVTNCTFDNNILPANAYGGAAVCMQVSGDLTIDNSTFTNNVSNDADGGAVLFIIFNLAGCEGDLSVTNSTFTGNSVIFPGAGTSNGGALAFTGQGGIVGTFNVTINNNTFTSNTADGVGGAISANNSPNLSISQIHYNRFVNNTSTASPLSSGLHFAESSGSVNAENNWWGCNTNPVNGVSTAPCNQAGGDVAGGGSLDASPWLQLRTTASPNPICNTPAGLGNTTTVTTSFLNNSDGTAIPVADLTRLIGLPVTWGPTTLGSLSAQQLSIQASGTATATFTSNGTGGTATVNTQVDNVPAAETTPSRASITVNTIPTVTNPANFTSCVGGTATFTSTITGTPAPTITWRIGGVALVNGVQGSGSTVSGQGTNTLTITNVQTGDAAATYNVEATNTCGTATSANATLSVNSVTGGTVGSDQTICPGGDPAAFTESAASTGSGALTYQWQSSTTSCATGFTDIGGATGTTYDAPSGVVATTYYRRVTTSTLNAVPCTANSNCITVTVNSVTGGTVAADQTICSGDDPAAFTESVASTGGGTLTYQWQSSTTSCAAGFADIGGATGTTYDPPAGLSVTTYYRRVTTTSIGLCTANSNCVTVFVNNVTGGTVAADQTICSGGDPTAFTESVASTGGGTLSYQWQSSTTSCATGFTDIGGATGTTYDAPSGLLVTTYYRRVTTSTLNGVPCIANSNCITVTVNPNPAAFTLLGGGTYCPSDVTLTGPADPNYTYIWERSLSGIANPNSFTAFGGTAQTQVVNVSGNYRLRVTNQFGCSTTDTASVSIADYVFNGSLGAGDLQQTGRLNRFAVVSTCAAPKACPGTFTTTGARYYDAYTITNPRNVPVCATIGIASGCGTSIFSVAYSGSFNPTALCTNYLADPGSSFPNVGYYEATIPANGTIEVVVHEVNTGTGCGAYTLTVDVPREAAGITATPSAIECSGTPITLTASAANSYSWSPGGATTQAIVHNSGTTNYTVTLGYGNVGCTASASQTATSFNPTVNTVPNQYYCNGASVSVAFTGTGATAYNWTNTNTAIGLAASGSGDLNFTATNGTASPISGTITVTPVNGACNGTPMSFTITVGSTPSITGVTNDDVCDPGGVVNLAAAGNGTINWWNAATGGVVVNTGTTYSPNISSTTTYYVDATTTTGPQNLLAMPPQSNTFPGNVRGYWFTAPADFVITSLSVPTTASSGPMNIAVVKFTGNVPPPVFSATTNAFTTVFQTTNNPSMGSIPCNIPVAAGEVIGLLGYRGGINSYAPGDYNTTIFGNPVQMQRLGMQFPLNSAAPPHDIWREFGAGTSISRVEFEYSAGQNCVSAPRVPVTGTVDPLPVATGTPSSQTVCSGPITTIVLSSNIPGTTFAWTRDNTVNVTGIAASGTGDISGTLTNNTFVPQTVTFTITPTSPNGCAGAPITATVDVQAVPTITCPANITVSNDANQCGAVVTYNPTVTGIPVPTLTYTFTGATTGSGSGSGSGSFFNIGTTTVSITATNACGSANCSFTVTVNDTQFPTITCPAPVTVSCAAAVPAVNIGSVTASDNCPGVVVTHQGDVISAQTCANRYTITRTYRATDASGNFVECTQIITVDDQTPPVLTCPAPVTVSCAAAVPAPNIGDVTGVSDNCAGVVTVTHQGDVISAQTCANRYTITRTYRATDVCGNFAECTQIITVDDQTPPVLTCPAPVTVSCAAAVPAPNIASVTGVSDNCAGVVTVTWQGDVISAQTCANRFTVTRTYRATDVCGNFAECTQIITVDDQTPPVLTCPGPVTVSCAAAVPAPNIASVTGVSDNCAGVVTVTWQGDVISNQTCANRYTVTRTYRATDVCGNFAECTQIITVNDQTPPVITCPAAITVSCASAVPAVNIASVTATDNCAGVITITHISDVITNQTCPNRFTLTRTYRATDVCGNFSQCTQIITVNDQTPPVITCPANITVFTPVGSCTAVVNFTVTATDNCGAVTVVSVPASGSVFPIGTTTVTSTATDACGMTATCTFTVTVNDVQLPVITAQPVNRTVCVGTTAVFSVTAITSPSANGPLAYQWQIWNGSSFVDIAGATAATLTLNNVTHSMNANSYRVRVIGLCTTIISNHATLTVNPLPTISISTSIQPTLLPTQTVILTANGNPGGGTYVWFKNNVLIPGATSQTLGPLSVLDAGTYKVTYTDLNGCVNTSADVIVKAQPSPNIWVYPNPNNGQFHIRFYNTTPQDVTVKVYDDLGQEIFSRKYPVPLPTYSVLDVDLGKRLAIGTYTVVLFNPANQRIGVKMIIVGRD